GGLTTIYSTIYQSRSLGSFSVSATTVAAERPRKRQRLSSAAVSIPRTSPISNMRSPDENGENGHQNGLVTLQNGQTDISHSPLCTSYNGYDREQVSRLLVQALHDLGYEKAASSLEEESGFTVESNHISQFRHAILDGQWTEAESLTSSLDLRHDIRRENLLFLIRKQKFFELLEMNEVQKALKVLRNELSHLDQDPEELHHLSSLLMTASVEDLKEESGWDGAAGQSRKTLLARLQVAMIPRARLASLLDQAQCYQISKCLYHTSTDPTSLFYDHNCSKSEFPRTTIKILEAHTDEVWFVKFSHNGRYLASASKDATVIIWNLETFESLHRLVDHCKAVTCVDWSPNDAQLLTCGQDFLIRLWDVAIGRCIRIFEHHQDSVSCCAWLPSGNAFASASMDQDIVLWRLDGAITYKWSGFRIYDLTISNDGEYLVSICTEKKLHVYHVPSQQFISDAQLQGEPTCVTFAEDSQHVLINTSAKEVQMWYIPEPRLVRKFVGQDQGKYVIRSCFGGPNQNLILSGSEDAHVYIWHRELGTLIERLAGHTGTVNCVAWNSTSVNGMFASAGDDQLIRM
ncbi:putative WD repeat-containing protein, partial [Neolecta irregularis DAH-3]